MEDGPVQRVDVGAELLSERPGERGLVAEPADGRELRPE